MVQVDNFLIVRKNSSQFVTAFDLLCKIYHVLNLKYPVELTNFLNFIDCYLFEILDKKIPSVSSLFIILNSINTAESDSENDSCGTEQLTKNEDKEQDDDY